ncbi:MAG: hypothetical protein GFH27_549279n20 [Chloroflexi bacterium AL-W]|nr:hypothetical protein [Chloroflexi bacterium AL-N1]NOK71029.1 hypothetical protein [Chloroflexi bacterium AL-N10]NOK72748.1 hypothetical protein [Chloroflexi bacterium AL-N5]NOK79165.1 hypothetical protein [Chloroflexi bacterium AL-W]NOK87079.1 hypothetical protein [Chloroflexi bacterium AL-N15]
MTSFLYHTVPDTVPQRKHGSRPEAATASCCGTPGRIRTADTRFRKPLLYPLSYGG